MQHLSRTITLIALSLIMGATNAFAHCQVPCGIYDDEVRFTLMLEQTATIEKAMQQIVELGAANKIDYNQIVRWTVNKDTHADKLSEIATSYFLAQRVKDPGTADAEAQKRYVAQLKELHAIVVLSMKAKQSVDLQTLKELRSKIESFKNSYGHSH